MGKLKAHTNRTSQCPNLLGTKYLRHFELGTIIKTKSGVKEHYTVKRNEAGGIGEKWRYDPARKGVFLKIFEDVATDEGKS